MTWVMTTTDRQRFYLTEQEKDGVYKAITEGKKFVIVDGLMIPLQIIPTILPFDRWFDTENQRLASSGKRLCRQCYRIIDLVDGCTCWTRNGERVAYGLESIPTKEALKQIANKHSFPELTQADKAEIENEELLNRPTIEYIEGVNKGSYIDLDTGETMYT